MKAKTRRQLTVSDELNLLYRKYGMLRARDVVAHARDRGTALHERFKSAGLWDTERAAERARLDYAGRLIRLHVTVLDDVKEPVRAWVSMREDRKRRGGGYRSMYDVMSDSELTEKLLEQAKRDADEFRWRYKALTELVPVFEAMEKVFSPSTRGRKAVAK